MYGIKEFTAIINPSQAAILAVGGAQATIQDGHIVSRINISLSCDGRVVEDSVAAQFVALVRDLVEDPNQLAL